jgi:glucose/arabinose dehydrogenase
VTHRWWVRVARILAPPAVVAVAIAVALRQDGVRRWLVRALDPIPAPAAAADVKRLRPTIEGLDVGRPVVPVRLEPRVTGIPQPTDLSWVPGRPDRLVVLSKVGVAWLVTADGAPEEWFRVEVATASELGLLGIAFHPKFSENGRFFVHATPAAGSTGQRSRILEGRVDPATLAGPSVDRVVLEVEQPYANHNGGQLRFGPDGMLYVALGDGGFRADPQGNGQNLGTWLGSILRIDVDGASPYAVPPDNPFVGRAGARPEIWAWGLRNPWRFAFDPQGRLIVADVGQNRFEEIDLVARGDNLGWNLREADTCFRDAPCATAGLVDPIWVYGRDEGISVTGGVVWTGPGPLSGRYLFGDFGTGRLWALDLPADRRRVEAVTALGRFALSPSAFGAAPDGSVWVADFGAGALFAVVPD